MFENRGVWIVRSVWSATPAHSSASGQFHVCTRVFCFVTQPPRIQQFCLSQNYSAICINWKSDKMTRFIICSPISQVDRLEIQIANDDDGICPVCCVAHELTQLECLRSSATKQHNVSLLLIILSTCVVNTSRFPCCTPRADASSRNSRDNRQFPIPPFRLPEFILLNLSLYFKQKIKPFLRTNRLYERGERIHSENIWTHTFQLEHSELKKKMNLWVSVETMGCRERIQTPLPVQPEWK